MPILLTGGSGRLGSELKALLPTITTPSSTDLDITNVESVRRAVGKYEPDLIVHAAAYTDVGGAEKKRERCWHVNVEGTRNLVRVASEEGLRFIHISTDYVFWGDRGGYREDDTPGPVRNTYALSKLVAEEVVRVLPEHLIIRTSFRPRAWPYPSAFDDLFTSQDYVDVIAPEVALAIRNFRHIPYDTLHIATERKSVFDLAQRRKPEVKHGKRSDASVALPSDISLDTSRWQTLKSTLLEAERDISV